MGCEEGRGKGSGIDLDQLDRQGAAGLQPAGLLQQRGGAAMAGEGDHHHTGRSTGGLGAGCINGTAEHLAIADRAGAEPEAGPIGADHVHSPAEATGSGIDGLIGATGTAMKEAVHHQAAGVGLEGNRYPDG